MRYIVAVAAVLGFTAPAFASDSPQKAPGVQTQQADQQPVAMTDAQLDEVAAGSLVSGVNVQALNNVSVNVPVDVAAAVNANVLGNATQGAAATATQLNPVNFVGGLL